jgi:hypothetical protein
VKVLSRARNDVFGGLVSAAVVRKLDQQPHAVCWRGATSVIDVGLRLALMR